jgi:ABC-type transport system involved in multi-copper enzyme maturation permease subunit
MTALTQTFPRAGIPRLSRTELRKMADTRAGFWLLVVVGLMAAAIVTITVIAGKAEDKDLASLFQGTLWVVSLLLPVLGILLVTSEWSQRTGLTTFALVPARGRVIAAKLIAAVVLGLAVTVVCLITAAAANLVAGGDWSLSLGAVGRGALFEVASMLGGVAFGLAFMSSPLAIVLYFALPTVWAILFETIHALNGPAKWLDTSRTFEPLVEGGMGGTQWAQLGTSLALWIGAFLVFGLWRLRRTELK